MKKILFKEEQKFGSMALYLSMGVIYAITTIIFIYAFYQQFVLKQSWSDDPMSDNGLLLTAGLLYLVLIVKGLL